MKIVFDARVVRNGMTGVGRYAAEVLSRLPLLFPDDEFVFITLPGQQSEVNPYRTSHGSNVRWYKVNADYESHPRGDLWEQFALPRILKELKADVFHGPAFLIPFTRETGATARVVTIHDLSAFTLPQAYPWKFRTYMRWVIARSLRRADRVICVSDFVRHEITARFPALPSDKFVVVPSAPAPSFCPAAPDQIALLRKRHDFPDSFLLMVGNFEPRKNPLFFATLDQALRQRLGKSSPVMLWAGKMGHKGPTLLNQMDKMVRAGGFRFIDRPNAEDLLALYKCADALVLSLSSRRLRPSRSRSHGMRPPHHRIRHERPPRNRRRRRHLPPPRSSRTLGR